MGKTIYTTIIHEVKREFGLTGEQYILCDIIHKLSISPSNKHQGWCWATKDALAEMSDIPRRNLFRDIDKLIVLGLAEKHQNKRFLKTTQLWHDKTVLSNEKKSANLAPKECQSGTLHSANLAPSLYKEEQGNEQKENPYRDSGNSKKIVEIIEIFKESLSPSLGYGNKTQRKACENLIGQVGEDESVEIAKAAVVAAGMPYGPRITTPLELWNNLGKLKSFIAQHKEFEDKNKHISDKQMEKILNNKLKL